jgi:hypothetical protein
MLNCIVPRWTASQCIRGGIKSGKSVYRNRPLLTIGDYTAIWIALGGACPSPRRLGSMEP